MPGAQRPQKPMNTDDLAAGGQTAHPFTNYWVTMAGGTGGVRRWCSIVKTHCALRKAFQRLFGKAILTGGRRVITRAGIQGVELLFPVESEHRSALRPCASAPSCSILYFQTTSQ